jgi:hypothetical protein
MVVDETPLSPQVMARTMVGIRYPIYIVNIYALN